jgi:hypothetical protein
MLLPGLHAFRESPISENAAALEHHVFVEPESADQFRRGAWLFRQGRETFSKRRIFKELESKAQPLNARAGPLAVTGWLCRHALALVL